MSHFTVLVITDKDQSLEDVLAPYQENNGGDCPVEYLAFNDCTDEVLNNFKEHEEEYENIEEFAEQYYGYKLNVDGKFGYWENPNAKWDWWGLGGRWTGFFKLKQGAQGLAGTPGILTEAAKPGYVDQARKGDIDFDGMVNDAVKVAEEEFDEVMEALKGIDLAGLKTWKQLYDENKPNIGLAREIYHNQPAVEATKEYIWGDAVEDYFLNEKNSREKFIDSRKCSAFTTFAIIYNGEWYEKGEMGWFACVRNEKSNYDWAGRFLDILDSLSDDAVLSLVDCHI